MAGILSFAGILSSRWDFEFSRLPAVAAAPVIQQLGTARSSARLDELRKAEEKLLQAQVRCHKARSVAITWNRYWETRRHT